MALRGMSWLSGILNGVEKRRMTELNLFLQAARTVDALEKEHRRMVGVYAKYLEQALKGSTIDWPKVNKILDSMSQYSKSRGPCPDNKTPSDGSPRWDEDKVRIRDERKTAP